MSEQSKSPGTECRTLPGTGQPTAPGAVVLKQNLAGFQPLQQVAERVGEDTDILLREVEGIESSLWKIEAVNLVITHPDFSRITQT